jgi:hypothetical protein
MGSPSPPKAPRLPNRLPQPTDPAVVEARRRQRAQELAQSGRPGTVLTSPQGVTGGTKLGVPALLGRPGGY